MTQEEKAKRYDEALERAKKLQKTCDSAAVVGWCEYIFPEIRESEDERVRKCLINGMKFYYEGNEEATWGTEKFSVKVKDILSWLEKQGEPNPYSGASFEYDGHTWGMCARDNGVDILLDKQLFKHLEKQDEQKSKNESTDTCDSLIIKSKEFPASEKRDFGYFSKPADKVEPKFKVDDWVVYYRNDSSREVLQVYDIRDGRYYFTDNVHFSWSVKECDEKSHLWTIEDARDGDVLACENGWTCIFKCLNDNLFSSYCFMDHEGWFCEDGGQGHTLDNRICGEIYPATNEQRDTLMKAIADAGYSFDFDKRELKKIEQKPAWSEEDTFKVQRICKYLNEAKYYTDITEVRDCIEWLKSLKPQSQWKPSDEQMEIIDMLLTNEAMDDNVARVLRELKEQLKKLKGE